MNRRTFLTTLLAVVTLPKAVMSKPRLTATIVGYTPPVRLYMGERWAILPANVLKTSAPLTSAQINEAVRLLEAIPTDDYCNKL